MALNPAFLVEPTSDPSQILLTDVSTGSDGAITDRQILLYKTDNTLLVPAIDWPYSQASIVISPLTKDIALNIQSNWNNSGGAALYTKAEIAVFTGYLEQFYYSLTQRQTSNPSIINDTVYWGDKGILRTEIDSANNCIEVGQDLAGAQFCIDRANLMLQNSNSFF